MSYTHNGKDVAVGVDKPILAYYQEGKQEVLLILAGNPYCACLPFRGVVRGDLRGSIGRSGIEYFEAAEAGNLSFATGA